MKKLLGPVVLALLGMLAGVPNALAGETKCIGSLAGTHDNVVVPAGATCTMSNATVKGNVKVYKNGTLDVFAPTTIGGSIDGEPGHNRVRLFGTAFGEGDLKVKGNVQLKGSLQRGGFLNGTQIGGNFQWTENSADVVASGGVIGGDLQVEKSTANPGHKVIENIVRGNLQCKESTPFPLAGNTVYGTKEECKDESATK